MTEQREQELLARIRELESQLRAALAEIEKLRRQLQASKERQQALEQEARRQRRQATPFAKEQPKPDPKRPGRKPGQGRFGYRARPQPEEVDETIAVSLPHCPDCGGPLEQRKRHEHFEQDLIVRKVTRRYVTESGYCARCQQRQQSRGPGQVSGAHGAAAVHLGPNVLALASDLKHRLGVPFEKLSDLLRTHFEFVVTKGGLCRADARLAQYGEPVYWELVQAMRSACVVHVDETGWRIGTLSAWLWVFTAHQVTVYAIDPSRGHEVVVNILGREFRGTLTCDCFTAYDDEELSEWLQQKCLAHLLKDLKRMRAAKVGRALAFARKLTWLFESAIKLRELKPDLDPADYAHQVRQLEAQLDQLIARKRQFSDPENRRMAKRLRKQRQHLFRFLQHDEVEATNNRAERMLRPAVIIRKTGRCNKTERGARTHQILASLFATCRQQGKDLPPFITQLLQGHVPSLRPATARPP